MPEKQAGFRRISDESVRARTGKSWAQWFRILDRWRAPEKGHTASARHLRDRYGLGPWWAQAVSIRYEWERGLRKEGRRTACRFHYLPASSGTLPLDSR